jgi:hypothetical protein
VVATAVWLPRALFESVLIVVSILFALALDEWQEDREIEELVNRSLSSFVRELQQNKAGIEAVNPYHRGLRQILERRNQGDSVPSPVEFRSIMEQFQPFVLLNSAWQTAVATGVLARMDYELVSALSLTYSTQLRFDETYRNANNLLLAPANLAEDRLDVAVYNASRMLGEIDRGEAQLVGFYTQTLEMITAYMDANDIAVEAP